MKTFAGAVAALIVAAAPSVAGASDPQPGNGGHVPSPLTRAAAERTASAFLGYYNPALPTEARKERIDCSERLSFSERKCKLTWHPNDGKGRLTFHAFRSKSDRDFASIHYWLKAHVRSCPLGAGHKGCDVIAEGTNKRFGVR